MGLETPRLPQPKQELSSGVGEHGLAVEIDGSALDRLSSLVEHPATHDISRNATIAANPLGLDSTQLTHV
jgi:hypothetical protein